VLFGRLRILGKLALLALVPLLGVVALSVPIVLNRVQSARDAQRTADTVRLAGEVGTAVQQLQAERLLSMGYLFGLVQGPELVAQTARAQDAVEHLGHLDRPLAPGLRRAVAGTSRLAATRAAVLNRSIRPDVAVTAFTGVITPILSGLDLDRDADLTTSVGRQVFALDQALRSDELINEASGHLTSAVVTRNAGFIGLFYSTLVQLQALIINAEQFFTDSQYRLYLSVQDAFAARVGPAFLTQAAIDPNAAIKLLDKATLFPSLRSVNVLGGFVEKRIAADVSAVVAGNRRDAIRAAYLVGGASAVLLLLVFGLSVGMARAVARPLRRLTVSADRIARTGETELQRVADDDAEAPRQIRVDAVDVAGRDEIGDLARAFDRVQSTAARLVERQVLGRRNVAQMFGHVGRRTQNLVARQLALIDDLERRETDVDRLRALYRLDHLSSRLRRNASSLVVLSGATGAGADEHIAPLPLSDVVRLALGEIEDYPRVDVDVPEEVLVRPAVVADLTLLLAELMENATAFSPPHTRVTVTAAERHGGARLSVVDHGLGLPPERLAQENARLTRRERLDLAPTEVLGLFVVGRLARRHGIRVTLADTPDGGLTAWVDLGADHLAEPVSPPIRAAVPGAGDAAPSGHGPPDRRPYDPQVLGRATRSLEAAGSWNAFHPGPPALEAAVPEQNAGIPVAGRFPAPAEAPPALEVPIVTASPPRVPQQRGRPDPAGAGHRYSGPEHRGNAGGRPLRRRVPGSQLPADTGTRLSAAPPTPDDATAARDLVEAVEAGVSRARWEAAEADQPYPQDEGRPTLARRVPGATLPAQTPPRSPTPPAAPADPLDPDAARALVEQFEYGVALALNEVQPQHEGQPR
jgi:signal transduction histidine kinase